MFLLVELLEGLILMLNLLTWPIFFHTFFLSKDANASITSANINIQAFNPSIHLLQQNFGGYTKKIPNAKKES